MKSLALTNKGVEDQAAKEIKELIGAESSQQEQVILFEAGSHENIIKLCYRAQSITRIALLLNTFEVSEDIQTTLNNISSTLEQTDFSGWLNENNSFKVLCKKTTNHDYPSPDIAAKIGEQIINLTKEKKRYTQKVDVKNPDVLIHVFFNKKGGYIGIDFCGFDLGKRDYKIFSYSQSLKSNLAYALLKLADYNSSKILLDPLCGDGTIPIEAALNASGKSVNFYRKDKFQFLKYNLGIDYDKFFDSIDSLEKGRNEKIYCFHNNLGLVNTAKKNSKIAGINKILTFGKVDTAWLDSRLQEGEIDCIVSNTPRISKHTPTKVTTKQYDELFYQAKYILKQEGKVVFISNNSEIMKSTAEKYEFKLIEERNVWMGQQELVVCVFGK